VIISIICGTDNIKSYGVGYYMDQLLGFIMVM
jgi:hypothetical protein